MYVFIIHVLFNEYVFSALYFVKDNYIVCRPNTGVSNFEESKDDLLLKYERVSTDSAGNFPTCALLWYYILSTESAGKFPLALYYGIIFYLQNQQVTFH